MCPARLAVVNGKVVTPYRIIPRGIVTVEGSKITAVAPGDGETVPLDGTKVIDASGFVVSPGFIDLHVHGGGGADVLDGTDEALAAVARAHAKGGTTAIVPTVLTCAPERMNRALDRIASVKELWAESGPEGAGIIGAHLEGPYLSPVFKGAQDQRYLRTPAPEEYEKLLASAGYITRVTAAPELPNALSLGRELKRRGILASMGHTNADYDEVLAAVEAGYSHVTHLYNAMSGLRKEGISKVVGLAESALFLDELTVEIIADGIHLPAPLLKLVYACKGPDKIALVTDALRPTGLPDGEYILGSISDGRRIAVRDGAATLAGQGVLAGSVATMNVLVRNMARLAGVPLIQALRMATTTPARILGIDHAKGCLAPGMDADLAVFAEDDFRVVMTMVEGRIVHDELTR